MKVTDFFKEEYVDQASYTALRKIASCIDGQKNTSRKILHTILQKNIKNDTKVSQLNSKVAEFTEYLHGDMSGVIVTLAQNYAGTNNIPLLTREGNFGTRISPEASAPRYIYTYGDNSLFTLHSKDDYELLQAQYFEGTEIEPKYFVPNLPILVINGSSGIGSNIASGFAQLILPRNPKEVVSYIKDYVNGKKTDKYKLEPYFEGFKGNVVPYDDCKYEIRGILKKKKATRTTITYEITELPVGYSLKSYRNILDKLENLKVINSYIDKTQKENFLFEVTMPITKATDEQILTKLKLIKKVSENYTCIDENNTVKVFNNIREILEYYIDFKLKFVERMKEHMLQKLQQDINIDYSKYTFIKLITEEKLKINKRVKTAIERDLNAIKEIIKRDNSYDYLLNMNIFSLTKERMQILEKSIKTKETDLQILRENKSSDIWLNELKGY